MSFDDPNREAVGLAPIWTGADEPPPEPEGTVFDPGDHTVAEVQEHLSQNPDDLKRVVKLEKAGKNRASIVDV